MSETTIAQAESELCPYYIMVSDLTIFRTWSSNAIKGEVIEYNILWIFVRENVDIMNIAVVFTEKFVICVVSQFFIQHMKLKEGTTNRL